MVVAIQTWTFNFLIKHGHLIILNISGDKRIDLSCSMEILETVYSAIHYLFQLAQHH